MRGAGSPPTDVSGFRKEERQPPLRTYRVFRKEGRQPLYTWVAAPFSGTPDTSVGGLPTLFPEHLIRP
jgi:hypothetical protein